MKRLTYWLVATIIYPLSLLPFWALYGISNTLYYLAYYLIGYRKKVVFQNLERSFPEKSEQEITTIAKQFYRNLCDLLVENIKFLTISKAEIHKRFRYINLPPVNRQFELGKDIVMPIGHTGNWEMAGLSAGMDLQHQAVSFYREQSNPFFNNMIIKMRTRFGLQLVAEEKSRQLFKNETGRPRLILFPGDQTPSNTQAAHWMTFLNQDTPVFKGTERIGKLMNVPVFFADIQREKRGYYTVEVKPITEHPREEAENAITEKYMHLLEEAIKEHPDGWLWSHKRWKHKRPQN